MDIADNLTREQMHKLRTIVETSLEKYRLYKSCLNLEGNSSFFSDEQLIEINSFCKRVENATEELPKFEKHLIKAKYLNNECDYLTDQIIYSTVCDPPVTERTYSKHRNRAMYKLAFMIGIENTEGFRLKGSEGSDEKSDKKGQRKE